MVNVVVATYMTRRAVGLVVCSLFDGSWRFHCPDNRYLIFTDLKRYHTSRKHLLIDGLDLLRCNFFITVMMLGPLSISFEDCAPAPAWPSLFMRSQSLFGIAQDTFPGQSSPETGWPVQSDIDLVALVTIDLKNLDKHHNIVIGPPVFSV